MVCIQSQHKLGLMCNHTEGSVALAVYMHWVHSLVSPIHNCCVLGNNGVPLHMLQSELCGSHADDTPAVPRMCHARGILVG